MHSKISKFLILSLSLFIFIDCGNIKNKYMGGDIDNVSSDEENEFLEKIKNNKTLLYKVSSKESSDVSYLYGTMHVIEDSLRVFKSMLLPIAAFNECTELVLETEPHKENLVFFDKLFKSYIDTYIQRIGDVAVSNEFTTEISKLNLYLKKNQILLKKKYPKYPIHPNTLTWSCHILEQFEPLLIEAELHKLAIKRKINTRGLEDQYLVIRNTDSLYLDMLNIFISDASLSSFMLELVNNQTDFSKYIINNRTNSNIMTNHRLSNDIDIIYKNDDTADCNKRNLQWLPEMKKMISSRPTFFAVGSSHLPGLLYLLEKEGFFYEPIYCIDDITKQKVKKLPIKKSWYQTYTDPIKEWYYEIAKAYLSPF